MIGPGHQDLRKSSKFVNQFSYCFEQDYLRLFRLKIRWVCIEQYRFLFFINWRWEISARAKREVLVSKAERYRFLSFINVSWEISARAKREVSVSNAKVKKLRVLSVGSHEWVTGSDASSIEAGKKTASGWSKSSQTPFCSLS